MAKCHLAAYAARLALAVWFPRSRPVRRAIRLHFTTYPTLVEGADKRNACTLPRLGRKTLRSRHFRHMPQLGEAERFSAFQSQPEKVYMYPPCLTHYLAFGLPGAPCQARLIATAVGKSFHPNALRRVVFSGHPESARVYCKRCNRSDYTFHRYDTFLP